MLQTATYRYISLHPYTMSATYCYMASNPVRLTDEAEMIVKRYGNTASKGIVQMEYLLSRKGDVSVPSPVSFNTLPPIKSVVLEDDWSRLEATVKRACKKAIEEKRIESNGKARIYSSVKDCR